MIPRSARYIAGRICCTLGMLWAAAGVLKELFGVKITLPFFPPLDLQQVHERKAMAIGLCLYVAGSWLVRLSDPSPNEPDDDEDPGVTPSQLASGIPLDRLPVAPSRNEDRVRR